MALQLLKAYLIHLLRYPLQACHHHVDFWVKVKFNNGRNLSYLITTVSLGRFKESHDDAGLETNLTGTNSTGYLKVN